MRSQFARFFKFASSILESYLGLKRKKKANEFRERNIFKSRKKRKKNVQQKCHRMGTKKNRVEIENRNKEN